MCYCHILLTAPYLHVGLGPAEESEHHGEVGVLVEAGDQHAEQQDDATFAGSDPTLCHPLTQTGAVKQ